jgi:hypothetical protein
MGNRRQRLEDSFWPQYVTAEALDKNPWTAAVSPLPWKADPDLVERVAKTAWELSKEAEAHRDAAYTREEAALWNTLFDTAWEACIEAENGLNNALSLEPEEFENTTWQLQPVIGDEAALAQLLDKEALRLISEPILPGASVGLLESWRECVEKTIDDLNELSDWIKPENIAPASIDKLLEQATARIGELDTQLEAARAAEDATLALEEHAAWAAQRREQFRVVRDEEMKEPGFAEAAFDATQSDQQLREAWQEKTFSRQSIEADPWTAVYLGIPENADRWVLMRAMDAAAQCQGMVMQGSGPQLQQGNDDLPENMQKADELEQRLEAALVRAPHPAVEPITPSNGPFQTSQPTRPKPTCTTRTGKPAKVLSNKRGASRN